MGIKRSRKSKIVRNLITAVRSSPRRGVDYYFVDVLAVDNYINMAALTGTGTTIVMTKDQVSKCMKIHGIKILKDLRGVPIQCRVTFEGGNILESASFHSNTY